LFRKTHQIAEFKNFYIESHLLTKFNLFFLCAGSFCCSCCGH